MEKWETTTSSIYIIAQNPNHYDVINGCKVEWEKDVNVQKESESYVA